MPSSRVVACCFHRDHTAALDCARQRASFHGRRHAIRCPPTVARAFRFVVGPYAETWHTATAHSSLESRRQTRILPWIR